MNIFKNLKYYFYISGVDLKKPPPDKRRFVKYSRKLLAIFFTTIMFVQIVWFILFEAERLQDCYESLFFGSSALICIIWWFLYQWNIQEFENLTDKLEAKVNESETFLFYFAINMMKQVLNKICAFFIFLSKGCSNSHQRIFICKLMKCSKKGHCSGIIQSLDSSYPSKFSKGC